MMINGLSFSSRERSGDDVRDALSLGLTPELRRTALRNGGVLHASTQAEPRSGLGLNELLGHNSRDRGL